MLRSFFVTALLALSISSANAGMVLLSCDLRGIDDFGDVEVKQVSEGIQVNLHMEGSRYSYYSQIWTQEDALSRIDLSYFNAFNDISNPLLKETNGKWFFTADGYETKEIPCARLK